MSEMGVPETQAMPYDIGGEERGQLVADGWQIWCDLTRKGNPRATLWVRWPKPPAPTLAEAMEELRETWRVCDEWDWHGLRRAATKVLAAYDDTPQAEDPTRDALIEETLRWWVRVPGLAPDPCNSYVCMSVAVAAYREAHLAPADD